MKDGRIRGGEKEIQFKENKEMENKEIRKREHQ